MRSRRGATHLRRAAIAGLALCCASGLLVAQEPQPVPTDEPAAADTLPADTAAAAAQARAREAAASDSVFQALLRRPGFTPMEYSGDSATFRAADRVLRLYGPAEVTRDGDRLTAEDTIVYRERTRFVEAYGRPRISGQAETIEGNVMFYDLATRRATVRGGRTQVAEAGATWFVKGDVTAEGSTHLYASKGIFTTDDREEPAYYFEADNIKVIRDRILVGRPARLYFRNVPVFWLPFVAQDLTRGRRSGLLTPEFSINDIVRTSTSGAIERGTGRQISNLGFYWAMSDYMDAQLSGAWRSGDYTGLRGALRYRWNSQFLDGSLSYSQYWRDTGRRELQFYSSNSWRPDERTSMALNANFASARFIREISTDYFQSTQNIASNFKVNRRFDWGTVDLGANRQQSVANDQVTMELPQIGIMFQPITLFRAASPEEQRWYSNATLSLSGSGSRGETRFGELAPRTSRDETRTRVQATQSFSMGNFALSSNFALNRTMRPEVPPLGDDSLGLPRFDDDRGNWSSSLSYRIGLIGETSVSPTLQFSEELRRDTLTGGSYLRSPTRMSFGASLNTALYGFLPGFGPFSAIRHKLTPSFSYSYVPEVQLNELQRQVFGQTGGVAQNNISLLSLNQTFEAKLRPRETETRPREAVDTAAATAADTIDAANGAAGADAGAQVAPAQDQKVTLLAINTSGLNYDFERARRGESGLTTRQVSNTISSDYMRGLQISMTHDLFAPPRLEEPDNYVERPRPLAEHGPLRPRLTGLSTQFSLGEDSPLLRFLGFGRRATEAPVEETEADSIPTAPRPPDPLDPTGRGGFTGSPQAVGRGPWRLDVGYTLYRPREGTAANDLRLGMTFSPTANWGVNWYTNYSIEDGSFNGHQVTLRRDLYRWEANFSFRRTPFGNTSFDVLVRLKDLPDLKFDYREYNIGANNP